VHLLGHFGRASFKLPSRPTRHWLKIGAPVRTSVRPLWWAVGRLLPTCGTGTAPSLSPLAIRTHAGGKYPPFTVSSSPPRCYSPFLNSFGGFTPLTRALLLPQFAWSSGKYFGLHRTSHHRSLLDASELLLFCFSPPMRHGLMSVVVLCSSGDNVGASSPT
jgi:hypothetical protein